MNFSVQPRSRHYPALVLCIALLPLFCGCIGSGPAIHEYTLYSIPEQVADGQSTVLKRSIMLMPVGLPSINTNPALLLRPSLPALRPSATHLWAGSLQEQVARVLAEDIRQRKIVQTVLTFPGPRFAKPDMLLEVNLTRFDGDLKKGFTCTGTWTLSDNQQKHVLTHQTFSATVPVTTGDYTGYVSAASSAIALLSEKIGAYMRTLDLTKS
ncbi:MAG TPA: membrane integrity-associated transporter subunit PqiC [Desulfobulbus sp.]|nr:membrane integrity-associated transporter subunit PqiC [Desulfobulbus sp.]